jgi:phosphatidylglycerophosphate synthase
MATSKYKKQFNAYFEPFGKALAALGFSPNVLTIMGLAGAFASCAYLVITENMLVFCGLILLCALFDGLDGAVARVTGKTTKFGAYLDAMCDRYMETSVIVSVAYVTGFWLPSALILIGVMNISYAKARAALEIQTTNLEWPDLLEKGERDIIYWAGLLISELIGRTIFGYDLFYWVLWALVLGVHFTVVQRMLRAKKFIEERQATSNK